MSSSELETDDVSADQAEAPSKIDLSVKIDKRTACERHVVVTIPRPEVDRYRKKAFDDLVPRADMPGFRIGKAPRKLVESRFREQIDDQVKGSLLMDSIQQVTDSGDFSAISEPDFDVDAIDLPESGDFTYEFKIEVRPEFDTPVWKGLSLDRPVHTFTEEEIDKQLLRSLRRFSSGEAVDGAAELGDTLTINISVSIDGEEFRHLEEEKVTLTKKLLFQDAELEGFDTLMVGATEGEIRTGKVKIFDSVADENLKGKEADVSIEVTEIRRWLLDDMASKAIGELGFENVTELREFVRKELERQFEYHQQQELRKQVVSLLTKDANWELPESLVNRQTQRELQRQALELRRSGFSDSDINRFLNTSRRNAQQVTIAALREHFVLEKIAEDEKVEPTAEEYEREIELIAEQSDTTARRIRTRLEKAGQMDALRNQIIERRVIEMITEAASLNDQDNGGLQGDDSSDVSAIEALVVGAESSIPEAKFDETPDGKTSSNIAGNK